MDAAPSRWPDLPSDLLLDISNRLRDPFDFVRFHAVCKPWRDTASSPHPLFLPWLAQGGNFGIVGPLFRSIFSKTTWRARNVSSLHKWLPCAEGTGMWLLFTRDEDPCLISPLTGAVTAWLPRFPDEIANYFQCSEGVVFADGTIVLCIIDEVVKNYFPIFVAAVLCPGDTAWTTVVEWLETSYDFCLNSAPIQINGEIMFADFLHQCAVKLRVAGGRADVIQTRCELDDPADEPGWTPYCYILESQGELLSVHVKVVKDKGTDHFRGIGEGWWRSGLAGALSVSLYALELGTGGERPRWLRRDGRSLGDRVLFLGRPASFAIVAARFGGAVDGGCAYFVVKSRSLAGRTVFPEAYLACKYSFLDGSVTKVAWVHEGWGEEMNITWFGPQAITIAPNQEIRERLDQTLNVNPTLRSMINFHVGKHPRQFGPHFKIYVGNLPWNVDSSRLRQFFSKHGQVADANIVYDRKTGRSRGFGFITMASIEEPAVAIATLDGLILDDRALRVRLAHERPRQQPYIPWLIPQQQPTYWWWMR